MRRGKWPLISVGFSGDAQNLQLLRQAIEVPAKAELRRVAHVPVPLAVAANLAHDRKREASVLVQATRGQFIPTEALASSAQHAATSKWPIMFRKDPELTSDPHARHMAEEAHGSKWLHELYQLAQAAKLPVWM